VQHLITDWYRNIHAFTETSNREEAIKFFANTKHWSYPLKDFTYGAASYFGDMLLVRIPYQDTNSVKLKLFQQMLRAYIVWDRRSFPMVIPVLCFLGSLSKVHDVK
jgi:hypothetical protein